MLYSICSMQFWINKSNLVCAENDLSTHLCIDCILSGWKDLQAKWKTSSKTNVWKLWQIAASSSCEKSRFLWVPMECTCTGPLPAQCTFAWVAAVKNPFYSKQMAHDLAEDSMWAKGMFFHVKWTWLGDRRPELVIPSILIYFCSSWWSQNIGLVHYKDQIGESR